MEAVGRVKGSRASKAVGSPEIARVLSQSQLVLKLLNLQIMSSLRLRQLSLEILNLYSVLSFKDLHLFFKAWHHLSLQVSNLLSLLFDLGTHQ